MAIASLGGSGQRGMGRAAQCAHEIENCVPHADPFRESNPELNALKNIERNSGEMPGDARRFAHDGMSLAGGQAVIST